MAASEGVSGFDTTLIWNYNRVLELTSISGPSESCETVDITNMSSDDGYKEFVAGALSGGELSLEGNLIIEDTLGLTAFYTDVQARTARAVWIVPPMSVGSALTFNAIPTGFEPSHPMDDKIGVSGTVTVNGKPTYIITQTTGISALSGIEETDSTALEISPAAAVDTYAYTCTVDTASTYVKLTVTAASHVIYVQGSLEETGVQTDEISLGDAGTDTEIFILAAEANKSPRLYVLTVTRAAA